MSQLNRILHVSRRFLRITAPVLTSTPKTFRSKIGVDTLYAAHVYRRNWISSGMGDSSDPNGNTLSSIYFLMFALTKRKDIVKFNYNMLTDQLHYQYTE